MSTIVPIKIADKRAAVNDHLQIFGWGSPLTNSSNRELQTGRITVLDRSVCSIDFTNRFCAGPSYFGGCQGEDGGAVASSGQLYGLIDYRSSQYCSETRAAHLYVDVFDYREWIASVIGDSTETTTPSGSAAKSLSFVLTTLVVLITLILKQSF